MCDSPCYIAVSGSASPRASLLHFLVLKPLKAIPHLAAQSIRLSVSSFTCRFNVSWWSLYLIICPSFVSSANFFRGVTSSASKSQSLMKIEKRGSPRKLPCGTLGCTSTQFDPSPFRMTLYFLPVSQLSIQLSKCPSIPWARSFLFFSNRFWDFNKC